MSIGKRIKKHRINRGMTQKELGVAAGFDEKSADVRIAQYESGVRTPKEKVIANIANALNVSPKTLERLDIDSYEGLAHTLFMLEDIYGLKINSINGNLCLMFDNPKSSKYAALLDMFCLWRQKAEKFNSGEITENEYNTWRYNFRLQSEE
jgi:transcriptional regulator with XRE-family HTH domain